MFHVFMHVPEAMWRWNAIRNFWGFFGERCMGYLIRHIHNRDLAAENIMTAYVRLRFIIKSYPNTQRRMVQRFHDMDMKVPKGGWTLQLASEVLKIKGALPGQYARVVTPTRRNNKSVAVALSSVQSPLFTKLRVICAALPDFAISRDLECLQMIAGVKLNGHEYSQGDTVAYMPRVRVRGNLEGVGGRFGASESHKIGTIKMMYYFPSIAEYAGTFVDIEDRPVSRKLRSLFIVDHHLPLPQGHHAHPITNASTLYHIDAITHKIKLVPHFHQDTKKSVTEMCGIIIWEAR